MATSKPLIVIVKVTAMVKVTSWSEQVQPQHNRKAKFTLYQWNEYMCSHFGTSQEGKSIDAFTNNKNVLNCKERGEEIVGKV